MKIYYLLSLLFFSITSYSQETFPQASFAPSPKQQFGFDQPTIFGRDDIFQRFVTEDSTAHLIPIKSIGFNRTDVVEINISNITDIGKIEVKVPVFNQKLAFKRLDDSTLIVSLPAEKKDYRVQFYYKKTQLAELEVRVFKPITHPIVLIELNKESTNTDALISFLDSIYRPSNINFNLLGKYDLTFSFESKERQLANPSINHDLYTTEMHEIRDLFLEQHPKISTDAFFVFLTPSFNNNKLNGYMARNKSMAFIPAQQPNLYHSIARQLGFGIGMLEETVPVFKGGKMSTPNLMDSAQGFYLNSVQWDELRHDAQSYSLYDGDEDVKTNNGMVAYYFWEEDSLGNILLNKENVLSTIKRPYKKNYISYHLNIQDVLFKIIWQYKTYRLCWWHLIVFGLLIITLWIGKWYRKRIDVQLVQKIRFIKWIVRFLFVIGSFMSYYIIGTLITNYEVKSGFIEDFNGFPYEQVNKKVLHNVDLKYVNQDELTSEILIKRGDSWFMKHRQKVLYFAVKVDSLGETESCRFTSSSDSLLLFEAGHLELAKSHYLVFNQFNNEDSLIGQRAYNHLGVEISNKLTLNDPAKRILLFVNGYRPTSIGRSFQDNFNDLLNNGIEYPNSANQIYDFDRYDYWKPWNNIDAQFKRRINPSETYYADGHHSVATSNHRSLINFTNLSSIYPKRCKDKNHHTCLKTANDQTTMALLPTRPNKAGFNERVKAGRIAGKNVYTMLNEIPNGSKNDTLYIIAHSMGYAYALGMIEELRGEINFGSLYIIAAENASSGEVRLNEWKNVWQYGSKLNNDNKEYPCLQDGIAPQICAGGLTENQRIYIPKKFYNRKGFFDSHFIGYYSWILSIKPGEKGFVPQN